MCALPEPQPETDVASLIPMVRRIVGARVGNHPAAEDLVQETLVRVLAASARIDPGMLEPYAIVTARNVIASMWRNDDRQQRNQHRVVDLRHPGAPDEQLLATEEQSAVAQALARLSDRERDVLLAHEVSGQDTRSLASERGHDGRRGGRPAEPHSGPTAGGVPAGAGTHGAAARTGAGPSCWLSPAATVAGSGSSTPHGTCSSASLCARLSQPLLERGQQRDDEVRIPIRGDADIVAARQAARELAARLGFSGTDLTVIATAVSEVARNIVRFAGSGEVVVELRREAAPRHPGGRPRRRPRHPGRRAGARPTATAPTTGWASACPAPAG